MTNRLSSQTNQPDGSDNSAPEISPDTFPIVGIGASAGGIEACSTLLGALPDDTGMAFIIIQHISADSPSSLPEIFGRVTSLPVVEVAQDLALQPNHVYVIGPGMQITLSANRLQLSPRKSAPKPAYTPFKPIDYFFESLAANRQQSAIGVPIGVVLSGLDGDGSKGLELIKAAGGVAFAQSEDTAQFNSMPNTAVETGMVDFILPPEMIAQQLSKMANSPYLMQQAIEAAYPATSTELAPTGDDPADDPGNEGDFSAVYALMRSQTGIDFSQYKQATFERRTRRRMALYHIHDIAAYVNYLKEDPNEIGALYRDVLITVTGFFRDTEAFAFIGDSILPSLVQEKELDSPIRVWVAGCSTGEECYSLAICLLEYLSAQNLNLSIQIFGTDASESVIEQARHGIYTDSQMAGVSFERRQRFFVRLGDRYRISKAVRELCVFARQDLSSDPPFSNIDLVSCRNVMIYFKSPLQDRARSIFHYSLNPGGYLWLGSSESVGETSELFAAVDRQHKVYSRRSSSDRLSFDFVTSEYFPLTQVRSPAEPDSFNEGYSNVRRQADQIVLGRYAPVGVVVNDQLDILHFRGNTSPYLAVAPGEPSFNLLKMARPELLIELRAAINQAKAQNVPVRKEDLYVENNLQEIAIEVTPINHPVSQVRNYLVLFEPIVTGAAEAGAETGEMAPPQAHEISRLERVLAAARRELLDTQAYLQATVEEKEASNQRLTTANEEILSSNEELQSTNEELQTAKEEVQAANEELITTNEELKSRNASAQSVNDDLVNLLNNVNIPIVILTNDLRIRRFTPVAQRLFKLIPTDIGRLFSDIRIDIDIPDLEPTILTVINSLDAEEKEVQDTQGRWYQLRIRPYRTTENQIDGAVMALVDINDIKHTQQQLEESQRYAEAIVETVSEPLIVVTEALVVRTANRAFYETFQVSQTATEGRSLFQLGNGQWDIPEMRSHLTTLINDPRSRMAPLEITHEFEQIGSKTMRLKVREIERPGPDRMILLSIEDITERRQTEAERLSLLQAQTARAEAEAANIGKDEFLSVISHELRSPLNAILGWSSLLVKMESPAPEVLDKALNSINRSAQNQNRIITDLLEVSRILQNKTTLQLEPINLSGFLKTAVEMAQPSAAEAEVILTAELAPSSDLFRLDPNRLHQVFGNAISNAIKFTPAGGSVQVSLAYHYENDAGSAPPEGLRQPVAQQARITITDSGAGIAPEFLPHVFDRFRQASSTNTRQYGGLGLGLAIVKSFVEAHGGAVEISSPGEDLGATLTILLPLTLAEAAAPRPRLSPSEDQLIRAARLLLIEDDLNSLEMMQTALETRGATVIAVESVARAIEVLTSQSESLDGESSTAIDLILSDISLPEQDGFNLIRWVRSHPTPQIRKIPAIAVTGFATRAHTDSILKAGFVYHLTKPIDLDLLVSAILSTLAQSDDYEEN